MKIKEITVERNFHIMNEDRFIMEKISQTIEFDENDIGFEHAAMDAARQQIIDNFKHAYPHLKTHLNFDETIQRDEKLWDEHVTKPEFETKFNMKLDAPPQKAIINGIPITTEKINKGTIEEQIYTQEEAVNSTIKEISGVRFATILRRVYEPMLKNFKDYPQVKKAFDEKMNELLPNEKK